MQQNIKDHYALIKAQIEIIRQTINGKIDPQYLADYEKFANSVEKLVTETAPLFEKGEDDKYPEISLAKRDELLKIYQEVGDSTLFVEKNRDVNVVTRELSNVARKIGAYVSKDINALVSLKAPATFFDVIEKGRKKVIDITGKETSNVGANLSSRTVVEKENGEKGVFTKATKFSPDEMRKHFLNKYCDKYPEYADIFNLLNRGDCYNEMNIYRRLPILNGKPQFDIEKPAMRRACPSIYSAIVANPRMNGKFYQLQKTPGFSEIMYCFLRDGSNYALSLDVNGNQLGVERNNENIDDRNVGMSIVAGLLGVDNVIAHSENVILKDGDKEIEGTVMDFAKGKDINKIAPDDSLRKMKKPQATGEALKQISNLEVLDFICGNVDRHGANMFYSIDDSDPKHIKLNGVMGIDNDASFGIFNDDEVKYGTNRMDGLEDIRFMDETTAKTVMGLTPGMLKLALQGTTINQKAIDHACQRLTGLQGKIKDAFHLGNGPLKFDENKLNIVADEHWKRIPLSEIARITVETASTRDKDTYFSRVKDLLESAKDLRYDLVEKDRKILEKNTEINDALRPVDNMIKTQSEAVKSGIWRFRGSSKQYNDIQKESIELGKKAKSISIDSTDEQIKGFVEDLKTTKEHVRAYLDRKYLEAHPTDPKKKPAKFGRYTKTRIEIMQRFYDNLATKENNLRSLMEEKDVLKSERQVFVDAINQAKLAASPKLQKKLQKDLNKAPKNVSNNVVVNNNNPVKSGPEKGK